MATYSGQRSILPLGKALGVCACHELVHDGEVSVRQGEFFRHFVCAELIRQQLPVRATLDKRILKLKEMLE